MLRSEPCLGALSFPIVPALCRFLASVDRPCLEAFRTLYEQHSFAEGWTNDSIGGIWDRQGRRYIVFDVDAIRQAAPGENGGRSSAHARSRAEMHTRQWIGTYAGQGNGDYLGELTSALRSITSCLRLFALTPEVALVLLDGQYGDTVAMAQLLEAGVYFVTRARGYHVLEHPQIQGVLAHPPTASVTRVNRDEVVEWFDGGWLQLDAGWSQTRVIVARHPLPAPSKGVAVGKCIGEWVYDLFITTLPIEGFLVEAVLDLYHGRGAFEAVRADEEVEEDPDRWCSYTECGQELWQVA